MHLDPTYDTISAWAAILSLPQDERAAFLAAAAAYHAAAAGLHSAASIRRVEPVPPCTRSSAIGSDPGLAKPLRRPKPVLSPRTRTIGGALSRAPATSVVTRPSLPLLGGPDLDLSRRAAFTAPAFRKAWRPGRLVHAYVASTVGLGLLVRPLQLPAYMVGADDSGMELGKAGTARDVARRMTELNRTGYGSLSRADLAVADSGFKSWTPELFPVGSVEPSPGSPVRVVGNGLEIMLPEAMTASGFDQTLARRLASVSLAGWAQSTAGRAMCAEQRIDPERLVRATPGPNATVSWSAEIVLIRPRHDALRLVRLCEDIVIEAALFGAERATAKTRRRAA